jgi:hypothetical protein
LGLLDVKRAKKAEPSFPPVPFGENKQKKREKRKGEGKRTTVLIFASIFHDREKIFQKSEWSPYAERRKPVFALCSRNTNICLLFFHFFPIFFFLAPNKPNSFSSLKLLGLLWYFSLLVRHTWLCTVEEALGQAIALSTQAPGFVPEFLQGGPISPDGHMFIVSVNYPTRRFTGLGISFARASS